ncbi:MAG TPA: hypothetical protein VK501_03060 [Baekduia sp.]|uniref:hypothetical protein n=1 Tax=Baekduia sp. TaxID=2600305 RepID=UPI002BB016F9|nr:hypothetical protein [Baekduia sp.]HMJ32873.1 hypothetical protein [Baekduia sp.]
MLEIRGAAPGLLDDPLLLDVGGAAPNTALVWRGRFRDDDGFVWRAAAPRPEGLSTAWVPAKPTAGPAAALRSLRAVDIDVRVEAPDGSAASRTVTRRLLDEGVRVRRWRDDVAGTLHLPAAPVGSAVLIDATARPRPAPPRASRDDSTATIAVESSLDAEKEAAAQEEAGAAEHIAAGIPLAAALLASRGVVVLVVTGGRGDPLATARERLAAIPATPDTIDVSTAAEVPLPAGVGLRGEDQPGAVARAEAWDTLLARVGARPRARR